MSDWMNDELSTIGIAGEIYVSTVRTDGSSLPYVPIWVVRVGEELYVRSYRGQGGSWYRHALRDGHGHIRVAGTERDVEFSSPGDIANETIDGAYRAKYGRSGYVDTMVDDDVAATTLRLTPR